MPISCSLNNYYKDDNMQCINYYNSPTNLFGNCFYFFSLKWKKVCNIKLTIIAIFKVYSLVALSIFTLSCAHFQNFLTFPNWNSVLYSLNESSLSPLPQVPGNHNSTFSPLNLSVLGFSLKESNHTEFIILWLAYFTLCLQVSSIVEYIRNPALWGQIISHCIGRPRFAYLISLFDHRTISQALA